MPFIHRAEVDVDRFGVEGLRCVGEITRTLAVHPNTCKLEIYGLKQDTRAALEALRPDKKDTQGIPVRIRLGYADESLFQVWLGDLRTIISLHEPPEWITTMTSGDGEKAIRESRIAQPMGAKTSIASAIKSVVKKLREELGSDVVSDNELNAILSDVTMRGAGTILGSGVTLYGSTARCMSSLCESAGLEWSVQDSKIQILNRGAATKNLAIQCSEGVNMIGAPEVDAEGVLKVRTLIVPDLIPGATLNVNSKRIQGFYRVEKTTVSFDTYENGRWEIVSEGKRLGGSN